MDSDPIVTLEQYLDAVKKLTDNLLIYPRNSERLLVEGKPGEFNAVGKVTDEIVLTMHNFQRQRKENGK